METHFDLSEELRHDLMATRVVCRFNQEGDTPVSEDAIRSLVDRFSGSVPLVCIGSSGDYLSIGTVDNLRMHHAERNWLMADLHVSSTAAPQAVTEFLKDKTVRSRFNWKMHGANQWIYPHSIIECGVFDRRIHAQVPGEHALRGSTLCGDVVSTILVTRREGGVTCEACKQCLDLGRSARAACAHDNSICQMAVDETKSDDQAKKCFGCGAGTDDMKDVISDDRGRVWCSAACLEKYGKNADAAV